MENLEKEQEYRWRGSFQWNLFEPTTLEQKKVEQNYMDPPSKKDLSSRIL